MKQTTFLTAIFAFLNENVAYAVLRNYEGLPVNNDSRDIDIAIEKDVYNAIRKQFVTLIEEQGWKIVTYLNSDRLITWVCGTINEEDVELVQLDFFFHTSVFGLRLIDNKDILATRQFNGSVYYPNRAYEFLDKYMYDRAVGAPYPEKYQQTRADVENDNTVLSVLKRLFGANSVAECDKMSKKQVLKSVFKANIKACGLKTIWNVICFYYTFARNYLFTKTGFSIGFTGPDGSGKTTVIDMMIACWGNVFKKAHVYYHFRPALFGNLGDVAHSAGIKKDVDRDFSNPHRGGKTGVVNSICRLLYYSIDYIIGYWVKVKPVIRINRLVVFDRYFTDIICDSRRSRIYLNPKFLYIWQRLFIPSLDYNILITADSDTILARKAELDADGINAINDQIDYLKGKRGYYKVMNDSTLQAAVSKILNVVFDEQHKKNLKRLNCK